MENFRTYKIFLFLAVCLSAGPANAADRVLEEKIRTAIDQANHCQVKDDCMVAFFDCPFGCGSYIHKDEQARLQAMVDEYQKPAMSRCMYDCMKPPEPDCVSGRCVAGIETDSQDSAKARILAAATERLKRAGYNLDGMEALYDEGNALWRERWDQILVYIPEGASPPNPKPEDQPPLIGRNYQAVQFRTKTAGIPAQIWVFVDRDTQEVIHFQEEAN